MLYPRWFRVVIQQVNATSVDIQQADYGATIRGAQFTDLTWLPPACQGERLAVRCHLAGVTPKLSEWSFGALMFWRNCFDASRVTGTLVEFDEEVDSFGVHVVDKDGMLVHK